MDVKICEIGSMPEWHIINDKMTYDKLTFILNFKLCQFGIVPFRHIKVKNFGPYMPNWHTSPYRLTQSRILALIFVYCLQNWQFLDDCLHRHKKNEILL